MITIGIVGYGFVGRATALFACEKVNVLIYDKDKTKCSGGVSELKDLSKCDVVFICVPTPMNPDGSCNTNIVSQCIEDLKRDLPSIPLFVRSTVPVGFCASHRVGFFPEFLTEANWEEDFVYNPLWVIGQDGEIEGFSLSDLILKAFNCFKINCHDVLILKTEEAELIKYVKNAFLATKVSFFNEVYGFCKRIGVDYENVKNAVAVDPRIGPSHSQVPGHDGYHGFGGTCLPKDISSLKKQMDEAGVSCPVVSSVINRNMLIDRPEKDWENNKGRAVV